MAVYVDWMQPTIVKKTWPYRESCHLMADTEEELHDFAINILQLKRSWFQNMRRPHYDLTRTKRKIAVKNGAIEVNLNWYKEKFGKKI